MLLCGLLVVAARRLSVEWQFVLSVLIESAWEVFENSAFVINRYREATAAQGYEGDTVANALGDIVTCAAGFWLARWLGWRWSAGVFVAVELLLIATIRDSLLLNVLMLVWPVDAIRAWQGR
jgi:hypothetical protein